MKSMNPFYEDINHFKLKTYFYVVKEVEQNIYEIFMNTKSTSRDDLYSFDETKGRLLRISVNTDSEKVLLNELLRLLHRLPNERYDNIKFIWNVEKECKFCKGIYCAIEFLGERLYLGEIFSEKHACRSCFEEEFHNFKREYNRKINALKIPRMLKNPKLPDEKIRGYVYFCREDLHGYTKIGYTLDPSLKRPLSFKNNLFNVEILYVIESANPILTERLFHERFLEKHITKEWFNLDESDFQWIADGEFSKRIVQSIHTHGEGGGMNWEFELVRLLNAIDKENNKETIRFSDKNENLFGTNL